MIQLVLLGLCSLASAVTFEAAKGKTEFLAVGRPSAIKINGKGSGPEGNLKLKKEAEATILNGVAIVDLSTLETGIGMRDRHMKETYLETGKFKEAKLYFENAKLDSKVIKNGGVATVKARLDLHGKSQPIEVELKLERKEPEVTAISKFKLKLSDFSISVPKYAGITVADEVQITTETKVASKALVEGT